MAGDASRFNGKKGGRPKGTKNPETLERETVLKHIRQRAMRAADQLFNAQLTLARGQTFLYKIEKKLEIGPKGGKRWVAEKPKLVTEQWEIEGYLEGVIESGDLGDQSDPAATYYFLTTKEPNNQAIDSLFDRSLGPRNSLINLPDGSEGEVNIKWSNAS